MAEVVLPKLQIPLAEATKRLADLISEGQEIIDRLGRLPIIPVQQTPHGLEKSDELRAIEADRTTWIDRVEHTLVLIVDNDGFREEFRVVKSIAVSPDHAWNLRSLKKATEASILKLKSFQERLPDLSTRADQGLKRSPLQESSSYGSVIESLKRSSLGRLAIFMVACISITWKVQDYLYVQPKEERIKQRDERIVELERLLAQRTTDAGLGSTALAGSPSIGVQGIDSTYVVPPTEIHNSGSIHALSGQVIIAVEAMMGGVSVRITSPERSEPLSWTGLSTGDRCEFSLSGRTYFVDVMSVKATYIGFSQLSNEYSVTISVSEKRMEDHPEHGKRSGGE